MKRGEIIVAATGGGFGSKPRPSVVIQSEKFGILSTLLVAPFTTALEETNPARPRFEPDAGNGLRVTSDLMVDILITVRRDQVHQIVGRLSAQDMARADNALMLIMGFAE